MKYLHVFMLGTGLLLMVSCSDEVDSAVTTDAFQVDYDVQMADAGCLDCVDTPNGDSNTFPDEGTPVDIPATLDTETEPQKAWTLQPVEIVTTPPYLATVKSLADGSLVACGEQGKVVIYEGDTWLPANTGSNVNLANCHGTSSNSLIAVGDQGRVWRRTGGAWSNEDLTAESPGLLGVYAVSSDEFVVVGVAGTIYRWTNSQWNKESLSSANTIQAVHGADELLFATGDDSLLYYDGTSWITEDLPEDPLGTPQANLGFRGRDIWAASATAVWAVGDLGKVAYRGTDGTWVRQDAKWQATAFRHIVGRDQNSLYAMGDKGLLREYSNGEWLVPTVESPEFTNSVPPTPWPSERIVPPQATLEFVGGTARPDGELWLFTLTGQWITYAEPNI
jgi:hypothetical protein